MLRFKYDDLSVILIFLEQISIQAYYIERKRLFFPSYRIMNFADTKINAILKNQTMHFFVSTFQVSSKKQGGLRTFSK